MYCTCVYFVYLFSGCVFSTVACTVCTLTISVRKCFDVYATLHLVNCVVTV